MGPHQTILQKEMEFKLMEVLYKRRVVSSAWMGKRYGPQTIHLDK